MNLVSVIMPVFNAEKTLLKSLQSIAAQTYPAIELVVVNDCSTDSSLSILNEFKTSFDSGERKMQIYTHPINKGVASARNTALSILSGEYIMYVDADDAIVPDAIKKAVDLLEKENSDIIGWDWTLYSGTSKRLMVQSDYRSPEEGLKKLMSGVLRWNLWLFMVKKSLYFDNGIRFIDGRNMGEDMMVTARLFMCAEKVSQLHKPLYEYEQTESSVSKTMSEKNTSDVTENVRLVESSLKGSKYEHLSSLYLNLLKLNIKLPLIISKNKSDYLRWASWFEESNEYIYLNPDLPFRTKFLQALAKKHMWSLVKLYNVIVYDYLYRIIHR